ncbi:tail fiber protein [Neisseria elongata]|nr:tail fiber protein [Neisseria elongata]
MANLTETNRWEAGIYQLETSDPVMGGPNGIDNRAPRELANRTLWLKTELAKAVAQIGANKIEAAQAYALKTGQITAGAGLTGGGTLAANRTISLGQPADLTETSESVAVSNTHSHKLPRASSTARGIVRVANTLTGTATDDALSAAMGKKLADEKLGNSGDQTITDGTLTVGRANTWNKIIMPSGRGNWIFEANPAAAEAVADSIRINFKFEEPGKKAKVLRFHQIGAAGETVAYQSWVAAKAAEAAAGKADTKKLTDEDLNSITTPGLYGQALNVHATTERNYPVQKAGSLLSLPSAYNSDTDMASHQIYIPFDTDEIWRRGKRNGGRWTEWAKITVSPAELTAAVESSVPSGAVMHFAMQSAPTGWLKADGSAVSRTQYPALFAAIGTTFGVGDGRTTFNLPDLRGEFVRGWDGGRNIDPGRAFGSAQGDAIRNITGSIDTGSNNGHQLFDEATATGALAISRRQWKAWTSDTQDGRNNPAAFDFDASRVVPTAPENRPRNIALLACIKI